MSFALWVFQPGVLKGIFIYDCPIKNGADCFWSPLDRNNPRFYCNNYISFPRCTQVALLKILTESSEHQQLHERLAGTLPRDVQNHHEFELVFCG